MLSQNLHQNGFSFIELLVSLLLFSLSFLGISKLIAVSNLHANNTYFYAVATNQLRSLQARLQANIYRGRLVNKTRELALWNKENTTLLIKGRSILTCIEPNIMQAKITWVNQNDESQSLALKFTL